jgi:hypothetical protein
MRIDYNAGAPHQQPYRQAARRFPNPKRLFNKVSLRAEAASEPQPRAKRRGSVAGSEAVSDCEIASAKTCPELAEGTPRNDFLDKL